MNRFARWRVPLLPTVATRRRYLAALVIYVWAGALLTGCGSEPVRSIDTAADLDLRSTQVYSTDTQANIGLAEFYRKLRQADYVLLGEVHDDPTHHELQRLLLSEIVRHGRKPAVVFEMFDRKDAGLIATAIRRSPQDPDPIADAVNWEASGWPDWRFYRPIVETALAAGLPIAAGNLSREELIELAFDAGWKTLGRRTLQGYGLLQPLPATHERALRAKLVFAHGDGDMPPNVIAGMLRAQRLRDASMAETMLARNPGDGAVLIAGREHARLDYGVPHYLRFREPAATIASVAFIDAADFDPDAISRAEAAAHDYLWVLPSSRGGRTAHE